MVELSELTRRLSFFSEVGSLLALGLFHWLPSIIELRRSLQRILFFRSGFYLVDGYLSFRLNMS